MVVTIGNKTESLETPCGEVSPRTTSRPWEQRLGSSQRYLPPLSWDLSTLRRIHEYVLQALVFYPYSILLIVQRTLNLKHQALSNHEIIARTNFSSCISKSEHAFECRFLSSSATRPKGRKSCGLQTRRGIVWPRPRRSNKWLTYSVNDGKGYWSNVELQILSVFPLDVYRVWCSWRWRLGSRSLQSFCRNQAEKNKC